MQGEDKTYLWFMLFFATLFILLFLSPSVWLFDQLKADPFNRLILLALPILFLVRRQNIQWCPPCFRSVPLLWLSISVTLYVLNENFLGVHIFSVSLALTASYGVLGFLLPPSQWRALFMPIFLVVILLPFEGYVDIYLGFPLRVLCADWAGDILHHFGFAAMSSESIIYLEESAANVDLACSGVRGLWAGAIFYILLSVVEGHRITWQWIVIGLFYAATLIVGNVVRIVLLIFVTAVMAMPDIAGMVHQPLGLVAFSFSCAFVWLLLRIVPITKNTQEIKEEHLKIISLKGQLWLLSGLLIALWLHIPYKANDLSGLLLPELPENLNLMRIELTDIEKQFFEKTGAITSKSSFHHNGLAGTILLVASSHWKAQHDPRNCYLSQGHTLGTEGIWVLENGNAVRVLMLQDGEKTGVYWFQKEGRVTPDFSERVLGAIMEPKRRWVMVSILWEERTQQEEVEEMLSTTQQYIDRYFMKGGKNDEAR